MTQEEKNELRNLRDEMEEGEDKTLLRRALRHIHILESKLHAVRTFAKAIDNESRFKGEE